MPIQIDTTQLTCTFCTKSGHQVALVRSMHGLYCTNEHCYSRVTDGNLVPPTPCTKCNENAFYAEEDNTAESAFYICIACGHRNSIE